MKASSKSIAPKGLPKFNLSLLKKAPSFLAAALTWADRAAVILGIVRRAAEEIRDLIESETAEPEPAE